MFSYKGPAGSFNFFVQRFSQNEDDRGGEVGVTGSGGSGAKALLLGGSLGIPKYLLFFL